MRNRLSRLLLVICALPALLALQVGCSTLSTSPEASTPEVRLTLAAGSDWTASDITARLEPASDGWTLSIRSTASQPAGTLLLQAAFPEEYAATQVQRYTPEGKLSLLVANRPGVLALGVIMPPGQSFPAGELLRARLVPAGAPLRTASKLPQGKAGTVTDLGGVEDGVGGVTLGWGYYNTGDYDQNSEANIADLTPLASHLGHSTATSDHPALEAVLDGDGNGEVNISDLTPLGANFLSRLDGYRIYRADGPDLQTATSTQLAFIPFTDSAPPSSDRRRFSTLLQGDAAISGAYYYVKPFDAAASEEGPASNLWQYNPTILLKFNVPPRGDLVADADQCQNPSLVLMPAIPGVSAAGAPVIAFTTLGGGGGVTPLKLGYYGQGGWITEEIGGGDNYSMPKALWIPATETDPGYGLVVVYDINALKLVERRFDETWTQTASQDIGAGSGVFSRLALDRDPATGALGVAHAYTDLTSGSVSYSYSDGTGPWTTEDIYTGDAIGGLAFRFDALGGDPWLLFTHGTFTTSPTISIDYALEQARRTGGAWSVTPVPYPDSPLLVDLTFRADGTPQFVCNTARNYTINIPTLDPVTLSLLFDVVSGEYNGSTWSMSKPFESSFGISLGFPLTTVTLNLDLASDVSWVRADELLYSESSGSVQIDITTYLPQGGGLDASTQFMQRGSGNSYGDAFYYGGAPGRSYSWSPNSVGDPVCAYVRSGTLSAADLLAGNLGLAGELAFWRP